MKKAILRLVAFCLITALAFSALVMPVSAFEWDNAGASKYATHYSSDYYTYGKFYKNMTRIPLTGDGARDVVAVAASQVGYLEGDSSYGYTGEVGGSTNYTEYGYYMGLSGGASHAWCAAFCSWVFRTAEVTTVDGYYSDTNSGNIWADTYVPDWSSYLISAGRYRYSEAFRSSYAPSQGVYIPQPGDLVFFASSYSDYPGWEGHIGLVAYCDGNYVYTLEGNTSSQEGVESEGGGMFFKSYSLWSDSLVGFGVMPYETVSGLPAIDYSGANPTPGLYVTVSGAKSVYLDKNDSVASWTLPMSSVFEVINIDYDSDGILMLYSKCEINGETVYGWIVHGSGSNGYTRTLQIYASDDPVEDVPVDGNPFWVTHFNNIETEGSGVIMTNSYTGGAWNIHVAFKPVSSGTNAYEITAISDGTEAGGASPLSIPIGGFVYTLNRGNDWPSIYASDPETYSWAAGYPDYTNASCEAMITAAQSWKVGDRFVFTNIDINAKRVPTPTPAVKWYESGYKCVAGYKPYGSGGTTPGPDPDPDPDPDEPIPVPPSTPAKPNKVQEAGIPGNAANIAFGCDLSFYNVGSSGYSESDADYSLVDFKKMKADGCDFAILRLGSADSTGRYYDPHFVTYYNMAREAGMDLGVYYYSYAYSYADAVADAEFVMDVIEDCGMYFEYPIYIDIEEPDQLALGTTALDNICLGWCETLEKNGYFPGIYGNYELYDQLSSGVINTYDTWIAWVSSADSMSSYTPWAYNLSDECGMWQYSFYGYEYDGIGLDMLDVNVAYKDYPAIMKKYGFNNINGEGGSNILSQKYYPDANTRDDVYADDGNRLVDGNKGSLYGGEIGRYSGWNTDSLDIIVETDGVYGYNTFNVYAAINSSWGINTPPVSLTVSVSNSLNGTYTTIAHSEDVALTATGSDGWKTYMLTAYISKLTNKRYVKFTITPVLGDEGKGHIWLDEIEVAYTANVNPGDTDDVIDNTKIALGDVNNDGAINQYDYILVKRHYFETRYLTADEEVRADVNRDGKVDQYDYILIARHYFGTYKIG